MSSRHLDRVQAAGHQGAGSSGVVFQDGLDTRTDLQDAVADALISGEPLMTVAILADLSPLAALDALEQRTLSRAGSAQALPGA
ncbi:hypothetical protein [Arthrobacter antioxidans]|uniref:hypothetical protein n=1 Tax=Arthrobacter antioxidans TaxID=2895818 RepID=UPI0020004432|nr:hypothetical protein [Arthrobacter antioxidans]